MLAVEIRCSSDTETGGAWLSSARVVRCWVKSRNERNPYGQLPACNDGDSDRTAGVNSEEGGDDVKSSCPLRPGLHTCYNGRNKETQTREGEQNSKKRSQFGSWAATRPREVGVASNRESACRGEYCSRALYTPPVKPRELGVPKVGEEPPKASLMTGVKS